MKRNRLIYAVLLAVIAIGVIGSVLAEAGTARPQAGFTFPFRQGGSADNWGSDGATNYQVTDAVLQVGSSSIPPLQTYTTIYFPQTYQYAPLVTTNGIGSEVKVISVSTNGFLVELVGDLTISNTVFNWMAVGE